MPILALTANVCPEDQALCTAAGMSGMLGKPVALPELLDAIARHVWPHRSDPRSAEAAGDRAIRPCGAGHSVGQPAWMNCAATLPADTLAGLVEECLVDLTERLGSAAGACPAGRGGAIFAQAHAMAGMAAEYGMAALESLGCAR